MSRKTFLSLLLITSLSLGLHSFAQTGDPVVSFSPPSLDFGTQPVGVTSVGQNVTATNTGDGTLTITRVFLTGTNPLNFHQTNNCRNGLTSGASCTITVTFTPLATGTRSASVSVTDNDPSSPQLIAVSGIGTAPTASLSAPGLSFAGQLVGTTSVAQAVTLTNSGAADMNVTSIVASGDFSQTNTCGSTLAAGSSCVITVTFSPTAVWTRGGSVAITDNSYTGSPQLIGLTGMGSSGAAGSLSTSSLSFGKVNIGTTSSAQTFTLTNTGTAALSINSIIATGDYAQTNNCGASLSIGNSCTVTVTFTPTGASSRNGWVTIFDTDASLLQTVTLTGTGSVVSSTVAVSPITAAITTTLTQPFSATINGVPSSDVTWSVDGIVGGNSAVGTISTSGLYTPPTKGGKHVVKAASIADPTQSASAPMVVTNYAGTFTYKNNNLRTGLNSQETVLNTGNVNKNQFGKLFSYPVDGFVYAQPLYVANVSIPGQGYHNLVYVATEHDSVYAFDADNRAPTTLWHTSFINPAQGISTVPSADVEIGNDLIPELGITGTPVIDSARKTLFVLARTKEVTAGVASYVQRLHALDITTGAEQPGSPVEIQATISGTGGGSIGGQISFDGKIQNSRAGMLLLNGTVYIGFGSLEDLYDFHGWVLGYDEATLLQKGVWNSTPNGSNGGIWQGGGGLAADASGNIYFAMGNGSFDADTGGTECGSCAVRVSTSGGSLATVDYFAPYNQATLNSTNLDLGAGGTMLLPDQPGSAPHLALIGGKGGNVYLLNRDNLGRYSPTTNQNLLTYPALVGPATESGGSHSGPAYWQGQVYYAGAKDYARQFGMYNGLMSSVSLAVGGKLFGYPGGAPVVSSNGNTNGIAWILKTDNYPLSGPAVLRAYDAANISREVYDSNLNPTRDQTGPAVKFAVPTVANGKVYVGAQYELDVYGLLP